jgi:hypothetical protein
MSIKLARNAKTTKTGAAPKTPPPKAIAGSQDF